MNIQRKVKIFRNGRNQAVRIPREFELSGESATMRKEDGKLVIEVEKKRSLKDVLARLKPLREGIGKINDKKPRKVKL
ncbi:MAG TPA: hypothetical protein PLA85_11365 [Micropepsaceae bacterium]|nr:hypothetical protein [Micropepsaceae bacterium]